MENIAPPGKSTITGRDSTIRSQFIRAKAPYLAPCEAELAKRLKDFNNEGEALCAYCGGEQTEWDHLFSMVMDKAWTGYFTEINNLIPACGKCNQSRGNKDFQLWMLTQTPNSPRIRAKLSDSEIRERINVIQLSIINKPAKPINLPSTETWVGELEEKYNDQLNDIIQLFKVAQVTANILQSYYQEIAEKQRTIDDR
jgi:hypothetical protein